jgi:hypothetical protein
MNISTLTESSDDPLPVRRALMVVGLDAGTRLDEAEQAHGEKVRLAAELMEAGVSDPEKARRFRG